MKQINWIVPQEVMTELEEAISKGDKKAIKAIRRKLNRNLKELEKDGLKIPNAMEWFYSMVPPELWDW